MPEITEAELKKQIGRSEFARFYFLYGEETYLAEYYGRKLIAKAGAQGPKDFNQQRFSGENLSVDDLSAAVEALPVAAERKCVAVSDLDVKSLRGSQAGKLQELLADLPDTCVLVVFQPSLSFERRRDQAWKKFLLVAGKAGNTVFFRRRTEAEVERFVCAAAERRGCALSRKDAARMLALCGPDLRTAKNEVEKLCAYAGGGEITARTVDLLTSKNLEARVFDLSKAILAGNSDKAYEILGQLLNQNEEPVAVLSVLSGAYLDLYRVKISLLSGFSAMEPSKHFNYARKEFRLTNAARDSKRYSVAMLRQSLDALLKTDVALKSARGDRRLALEKLVAELIWIVEREKMD